MALWMMDQPKVTNRDISWARRTLTLFVQPTMLPLSQTSHLACFRRHISCCI